MSTEAVQRVICIVGMWDSPKLAPKVWGRYLAPFAEHMPNAEVILEHETYTLHHFAKIKAYGQRILDQYDDGIPTLLLGMSLGGVVACGIAPQFKKTPILGVVTIEAPLKLSRVWGYPTPDTTRFDLLCFGCLFDIFVPFPLTYTKQATRRFLFADHLFVFMSSNYIANTVVKHTAQWINMSTQKKSPFPPSDSC